MNREEDVSVWVEIRARRLLWLSDLLDSIESSGGSRDDGVHVFLKKSLSSLEDLEKRLISGSSCPQDCGSLCCYFSADHSGQMHMTNDERDLLDKILAELGEKSGDHYTMVPFQAVSRELRDYLAGRSQFIFDLDDIPKACMLNPSERVIEQRLLEHAPKTVKKHGSMWVDKNSRACRFLDTDGKCVLYNRLRFTKCREFHCLTAIMLIVLRHLGLSDEKTLRLPMGRLNRMSGEISKAFERSGILGMENEFDRRFRELASAYARGLGTLEKYGKLVDYERDYKQSLMRCIKNAVKPA